MEKYLELKKAIEEFLELRKNLNNRKDIKESRREIGRASCRERV